MTSLNKQQLSAVNHPLKPLLILAGAGTGKTTTIIDRIATLVEFHSIDPSSILVLTFTTDAANSLKNKLSIKIGSIAESISASTFHSFANNITMECYKELGYSKIPSLVNNIDIYHLLRNKFNDLENIESRLISLNPIKSIPSFQKIYNSISENLLDSNNLLELCEIEKNNLKKDEGYENKLESLYQLSDIIKNYNLFQKYKRDRNWVDYADLITNLWYIISNRPKILFRLRKKYRHIVIDEFQDNNYSLSIIIDKIANTNKSITVVGDDDQCIYAFRQANILNIKDFEKKYLNENNKPVNLIQNYRSVKPILNLANYIISKNKNRMNKKELFSKLHSKQIPKLYIGDNNSQLMKLKDDIQFLIDSGVNPRDIAILLRTNSKCEKVSLFLKDYGISTSYTSLKLFEQSSIKDIIALINIYFKSYKQEHSIIRILKKYNVNLNKYLKLYESSDSELNFLDYVLTIDKKNLSIIKDVLTPIYELKINDINNLVWEIIKILSPYKSISNKHSIDFLVLKESLDQFISLVSDFSNNYSKYSFNEFIKYINLQLELNELQVNIGDKFYKNSIVNVMTVHASKGLEFSHVFIPFLSSGSFPLAYKLHNIVESLPSSWNRWNIDTLDRKEVHYEEERRLLYVAITRAMLTLTLFTTNKRQSMFIKDIDTSIIKKEEINIKKVEINKFDKLIGIFKSKIALELSLDHYTEVSNLINAIKNTKLLSNGIEPNWADNPYKNIVENSIIGIKNKDKNKKILLSASRISVFDQCPLKYKFTYVDKIPQSPNKGGSQLGILMHKVLELYHLGDYSTLPDLNMLLDIEWKNLSYEFSKQNYQEKKDAESMLENYWNFIQENPANILSVEYNISFETNHAIINGKCDRIDFNDNNFSIYDYKTSKTFKTSASLKKDIQLGIYAYFLYKIGIERRGSNIKSNPHKVSMIYLRREIPEVSTSFTEQELDNIKEKLDETAKNIKQNEFSPCVGMHCEWCDYKDLICPEYG